MTVSASQTVPLLPETAPFTPEQRAWLNGFLAGLFSRGPVAPVAGSEQLRTPAVAPLQPLTILFGSQTGTAEALAKRAAKEAGKRGFAASIMDLAGFTTAMLAQEQNVLLITSTYGDGEPPDNAKALHAALATDGGGVPPPRLEQLRYSVCALGDTNYVQFCQCGKDFDERLARLGATRVAPRIDCDLDYEAKFTGWLASALAALSTTIVGGAPRPDSIHESRDKPAPTAETVFTRQNPFPARVTAVRCLNAPGSAKEVNHVELSLDGSGLAYEAGDALGVMPQNCPELVDELLATLGCDGEEAVPVPEGGTTSLRHALTACYDIEKPSTDFIARYAAPAPAGGGTAITTTVRHVIDVLLARPETRLAPADFVRFLRKLQPRLYSIASSPKAHPGLVQLTVGAVRYEAHGRARKGVCSTFLGDRCPAGSTARVFVHSNSGFRPPASGDTAMIMVGPGTGIAPFRAFLEERHATKATGKNWLFFGDQHAATDFLYRDELLALQAAGVLTRLDTAFSRDQPEKIYVQQRMLEHAAELFAWLEAGAHFYVCGDAGRMAKDVDAALHRVIEAAGGRTPAEAAEYVASLKKARRYQRDVY
ncbi:MAG TPA: sulfite reductase subunit alpha [Lacunisphaera sp.]|nr:sulfite reductase subunit alpha [Lacunisphaera sp.]